MIIDHVGSVFYPHDLIFRVIGRASFIIYSYMLSIGATKTHNKARYLTRILLSAILSQFFYYNLISFKLNVCFTLAAGLLVIMIYDSNMMEIKKYACIMLVLIVALFLGFEYGVYGISVIFIFYYFRNKQIKYMVISHLIALIISYYVFGISSVQFVSLISLMLIVAVQKKDIKNIRINWKIKYFNYLIYPMHLAILLLIKI